MDVCSPAANANNTRFTATVHFENGESKKVEITGWWCNHKDNGPFFKIKKDGVPVEISVEDVKSIHVVKLGRYKGSDAFDLSSTDINLTMKNGKSAVVKRDG